MKFIIQRVKYATLKINNEIYGQINNGLVCYVGFCEGDQNKDFSKAINKLCGLRIFEDEFGKMNLNVSQINGNILIVPNFTLYANSSHGYRPSFIEALAPNLAKPCFERFVSETKLVFPSVQTGVFGADMQINLLNDGPINIIMEF